MSRFYVLKKKDGGKISPYIEWTNGKVEALHVFTNKKTALSMAMVYNAAYGVDKGICRNPWGVKEVKITEVSMAKDYKLCRLCGQPMKPKGIKKMPNEYDHAQGCPYARKGKRGTGK